MESAYDKFAELYDRHWGDIFLQKYESILRSHFLNELRENSMVIDLGCGSGQVTNFISSFGHRIVGVDQSKALIAFAEKKYPQVDFIADDILKLKFPEKFDAAISTFNCFNHFLDEELFRRAINSVYELLRPEGIFFFDLNMKECFESRWRGKHVVMDGDSEIEIERAFDSESLTGKYVVRFVQDAQELSSGRSVFLREVEILERCYTAEFVLNTLNSSGFCDIKENRLGVNATQFPQQGVSFFLARKN